MLLSARSFSVFGITLALLAGVFHYAAPVYADCRQGGGGYYQGYNNRPFVQNYAPYSAPVAYYGQPPVQVVNNYGYGGGGYYRGNHGRGHGNRHWNRTVMVNQGHYVPYRTPHVNVNVGW